MSLWSAFAVAVAAASGPDLASLARLEHGPHEIGVRVVRVRDPARPWPAGDDPEGAEGRPIQFMLWYPADRGEAPPMTVEDHVLADWTGELAPQNGPTARVSALAVARRAFEEGLEQPLSDEQWARARSARGRARPDAKPLPGRRALLLFEGGFNGRAYVFLPLVEVLASHGYVVASLASYGRGESERLGFDLDGVRAQLGDLKLALEMLRARPEVDPSRVALVAWSAGGVAQALFRRETPEAFRAAVSLDSATGYAYGAELLREAGGVEGSRLTVPFLQVDATAASVPVPRDDSFYRAHGRAPAVRAALEGLRHGDLVLPYGVGRAAALGQTAPDLRELSSTLLAFLGRHVAAAYATERLTLESHGWRLAGDLVLPDHDRGVPVILLLNRAAGNRRAYTVLAEQLARRGIASLRLDLRGHGESTSLGRFVPGPEGLALIARSDEDVAAAFGWLARHPRLDAARIGIVGASYSGELMMQATTSARAAAYVALSPGSLSDESIAAIDRERLRFLLVAARDERHLKEVVQALREQSRSAELLELGGTEHATGLLEAHPHLADWLAAWFVTRLSTEPPARP